MHSPAHKNAPVQHKVFKRVHVVILKLVSNSGRATKDTHPTVAGCFHHKEIPPAYSYVLSQLRSPHEPIHQATVQSCKPKKYWRVSPFPLHSCTGGMQVVGTRTLGASLFHKAFSGCLGSIDLKLPLASSKTTRFVLCYSNIWICIAFLKYFAGNRLLELTFLNSTVIPVIKHLVEAILQLLYFHQL